VVLGGAALLPFKHLDVSLLASSSSNSLRSPEKIYAFLQDSANKVFHVYYGLQNHPNSLDLL
jgi:hypothetical protein